ncbi:uncharacterized protein LOC116851822 [Odontomachus brunneus]|uniref:uncharacterized protein LOC116851822 n=1 Tax=Odontomachus brunneus TaxID=486640 RepID=UPI0013F2A280|nr:uncharacterized protein LOC116851822 [Odontomachus brunneus]
MPTSTLLALLGKCEKFRGDPKLMKIIREILIFRRDFEENIEDVWDIIADVISYNGQSVLIRESYKSVVLPTTRREQYTHPYLGSIPSEASDAILTCERILRHSGFSPSGLRTRRAGRKVQRRLYNRLYAPVRASDNTLIGIESPLHPVPNNPTDSPK